MLALVWIITKSSLMSTLPTAIPVTDKTTITQPPVLTNDLLADFSSTTIEKRCPFYKPNGSEYRECLSSWVDELEEGYLVEQLDEIQNYCLSFVKANTEENSLEGAELYLRCEIYELQ